jgi:aminoglycoside 3-N-acetyltransferase
LRSANPDSGIAAIGARARWLVEPHGPDDGFGPATPYARLVEADGQVLLLGAPLESISVLHHAEATAAVPAKRVRYRVPVQRSAGIDWQTCEDIDVRGGPVPYEEVIRPGEPPLAVIARAALSAGVGTRGRIGGAACHLFRAAPLVRFATGWLEERFA